MTTAKFDMQNLHGREAKSPLLFCTAQIYGHFNRKQTGRPTATPCNAVKGSETEMSIRTITNWYEGWKRYRTAVRELSQLTDRELNDLGIQRTEIDLVARQSLGV